VPDYPAAQYDEVPFPSLPMPASRVEHLALLARLRGLEIADVEEASVLELGCANGQNLLPMAERHSAARFLGIDVSERQIESANLASREIGLSNAEFRPLDISDLPADLGTFDYIIAHAVYSWVDARTRDRLLAACQRHLAPQGIAFVSYNVYPGWHVHDILRAAMLYDARDARSTAERLRAARTSLEFLNDSLDVQVPYDAAVKAELTQLMAQSDGYLLHDHLEPINQPVYYREFAAHARRHGLQPAGDCVLGIRFADYLGAEAEERLAAVTPDAALKEQFRDIVRNRSVRHTLLCHEGLEVTRGLAVEQLSGTYLAANLRPENPIIGPRTTDVVRFVAANGLRISTGAPVIKAALAHLATAWPGYVAIEELTAAAWAALEVPGETAPDLAAETARLHENLLQCCAGNVIELHGQPHPFSVAVSAKPTASPIARWQARFGSLITNRKHEAIQLGPFERQMLELLDGTNDLEQIVGSLQRRSAEGRFAIIDREQPVTDPQQVQTLLDLAVPDALARLAQNAFLVA
jgi:methyltransferase-like protein/trans-aconitate methyltransferase